MATRSAGGRNPGRRERAMPPATGGETGLPLQVTGYRLSTMEPPTLGVSQTRTGFVVHEGKAC